MQTSLEVFPVTKITIYSACTTLVQSNSNLPTSSSMLTPEALLIHSLGFLFLNFSKHLNLKLSYYQQNHIGNTVVTNLNKIMWISCNRAFSFHGVSPAREGTAGHFILDLRGLGKGQSQRFTHQVAIWLGPKQNNRAGQRSHCAVPPTGH